MYLTGFADEAASDIDGQIQATKELGWENIEARNINGNNIHDISDDEFDVVYGKLADAGVKVNCFGSTIANWGKNIDKLDEDTSFEQVARAIPRMKKLGTKLVRIMSYAVLPDRSPNDQMIDERVKRLSEICKMFTDEGILPVHENCMNYGGMGWEYTLELVEKISELKLLFDTGNPVFTDDRTKPQPYPKQSSWEFYSKVKEHIAYVHIKDGVWNAKESKCKYTFSGEGDGNVKRIVKDLLDNGYDGGFSMEPHLATVFHDDNLQPDKQIKYNTYISYGRKFMELIKERSGNHCNFHRLNGSGR